MQDTRYPPENAPYQPISKVVMVVDKVSTTPFALLRRARHFEYRQNDRVLRRFSEYQDPVEALTDECKRVLKSISSANQSDVTTTKASTSLGDASWSRFEDVGFGDLGNHEDQEEDSALGKRAPAPQSLRSAPESKSNDLGRPTTPSWADFLSSGFADEPSSPGPRPLLLPPDKVLPPIDLDLKRGKSSQSHKRIPEESNLEPGELASINALNLDDAFWWVWITSLAGEETSVRKAVFGRCALVETNIGGGAWLVVEEIVKGAAPEPEVGAYIAEKKSRFTFGKKSKMSRTKSMGRTTVMPTIESLPQHKQFSPASKTSIGPDQHARIQAAAAALQQRQKQNDDEESTTTSPRRARHGDGVETKTNSVLTLQPVILSEAAPAMKWANSYDKQAVRSAYLGNNFTGKGSYHEQTSTATTTNSSIQQAPREAARQELRELPALPPDAPGEGLQGPTQAPQSVPVAVPPLPVESEPKNIQTREAAQVPLPETMPEEPSARPPPPPPPKQSDGPEENEQALEQTENPTEKEANGVSSPISSPEGKGEQKKLKKQPGSGGLRGIFGNKKKSEVPVEQQPPDSSAVAAARAAYTGPTKRNMGRSNSLTRRFSGIGRKKPLPSTALGPGTLQDLDEPLPPPPAPFKESKYNSQTSLSRIDSMEERRADDEFRVFDQQGPVEMPASVPEDTPRDSLAPASEASRPSTSDLQRGPHFDPPIGRGQYEPSASSDDEDTAEEGGRHYGQAKNRWSQIRRNAAERAGRASEDCRTEKTEQTEHTEDQTEDGDESGEESTYRNSTQEVFRAVGRSLT